jgi:hypothetical protein
MNVEILSTSGNLVIRKLTNLPCVGEVIIDSLIGQAQVADIVWLTDTDTARLYVKVI